MLRKNFPTNKEEASQYDGIFESENIFIKIFEVDEEDFKGAFDKVNQFLDKNGYATIDEKQLGDDFDFEKHPVTLSLSAYKPWLILHLEKEERKQARVYDSPLIRSLLAETTPEAYERTCNRMMMAARIDDGIIAKGWSKEEFAQKMDVKKPKVDLWLCGSHNFTLDTLTDIQRVLEIKLLCVEVKKQ
jgi:hypothetical protein